MLIEVHNIEEYNNNIDKCCGYGRYFNKNANTLSWKLRNLSEFKDEEIRKIFGSNVSICDEAIELLGKPVVYSGVDIGILTGVEITEEDFYWITRDLKTSKECRMSCVGRIDEISLDLLNESADYGHVKRVNTSLSEPELDFINGAIWRESNPTPTMIERILKLAWEYREDEDMTNLEYILKNYNKK